MGWRGVLRSAIAANRAAEREQQRLSRAVQRGHDQADRLVDRLDGEVASDLQKLERVEERLQAKPISVGGLCFDAGAGQWRFKEFSEQTGQLRWRLNLSFPSDPINVMGRVDDAGQTYEFIAMVATRWGVFVAFRVFRKQDGSTAKPTKLFNKSNPAANRMFLVSGGVRYRALEGQDLPMASPGHDMALAAFPVPGQCGDDLAIEFLLKSGVSSMRLQTQNASIFADAGGMPTLVDAARAQLAEQTDPLRQEANETKERIARQGKSGSGWWGIVLVILVLILIMILRSP